MTIVVKKAKTNAYRRVAEEFQIWLDNNPEAGERLKIKRFDQIADTHLGVKKKSGVQSANYN